MPQETFAAKTRGRATRILQMDGRRDFLARSARGELRWDKKLSSMLQVTRWKSRNGLPRKNPRPEARCRNTTGFACRRTGPKLPTVDVCADVPRHRRVRAIPARRSQLREKETLAAV